MDVDIAIISVDECSRVFVITLSGINLKFLQSD
jgi:hypothetical protein